METKDGETVSCQELCKPVKVPVAPKAAKRWPLTLYCQQITVVWNLEDAKTRKIHICMTIRLNRNTGATLICERVSKTACEGLPLVVLCTNNRFYALQKEGTVSFCSSRISNSVLQTLICISLLYRHPLTPSMVKLKLWTEFENKNILILCTVGPDLSESEIKILLSALTKLLLKIFNLCEHFKFKVMVWVG